MPFKFKLCRYYAKAAVKRAEQRAAIAKSAAAAAARAQVSAEAEAIRLTGENKRLRDEAATHFDAAATLAAESEASLLARDGALAAQNAAESAAADLAETCGHLEGSVGESRQEVEELNAVLRARTQDITQLGQIIISVYKGEIQSEQLGEIAAGIANIIGPQMEEGGGGGGGGMNGGGGGGEVMGGGMNGGGMGGGVGGGGFMDGFHHGDASHGMAPPHSGTNGEGGGGGGGGGAGEMEEEEDTSVPVDSAFYGVEAEEITWEEPLSVRETKTRPKGMPGLALEKLAPPPEDPDAAMLEFAYEQQYGKEEAKRMIAEAKAAEVAKQQEQ